VAVALDAFADYPEAYMDPLLPCLWPSGSAAQSCAAGRSRAFPSLEPAHIARPPAPRPIPGEVEIPGSCLLTCDGTLLGDDDNSLQPRGGIDLLGLNQEVQEYCREAEAEGTADDEFVCYPAWKKLLGPVISFIDALLP
jgi:hypothetical protein